MTMIDMTNHHNRRMFHLLQCRAALRIEIKTGMSHSGGSILKLCQNLGYVTARTKIKAYQELNALVVSEGGADRPL